MLLCAVWTGMSSDTFASSNYYWNLATATNPTGRGAAYVQYDNDDWKTSYKDSDYAMGAKSRDFKFKWVNEASDSSYYYIGLTTTTEGTTNLESTDTIDSKIISNDKSNTTATCYANVGKYEVTQSETNNALTAELTDADGLVYIPEVADEVALHVDTVTLNRQFTAGVPSTVILPFSISAANVTGGKFYTFNGVSYDEAEEQWEADMTEVTELVANTPYIFVPTGDAMTFDTPGGVDLVADQPSYSATNVDEKLTMERVSISDSWYTLDGRLLNGQPTQKGIYIKNGKKVIVQ